MSEIAELYRSDNYSHRVAAEVRAHAARQGLMQKDLAKALGYVPSQITKRMRGQVPFTLDEIAVLARIFEIEPSDLLPKCAVRDLNPEPAGLVLYQDDRLATVLPIAPSRLRRLAPSHDPIRRDPHQEIGLILMHRAVSM